MIVHRSCRNTPIDTITNPHPTPLRLLLTLLCILNFSSIWWECTSVSQLETIDSPKPTFKKAPFCNTCLFNDTVKEEAYLAFASVQLRCLCIQAIDFHDMRHMIQWIIFLWCWVICCKSNDNPIQIWIIEEPRLYPKLKEKIIICIINSGWFYILLLWGFFSPV